MYVLDTRVIYRNMLHFFNNEVSEREFFLIPFKIGSKKSKKKKKNLGINRGRKVKDIHWNYKMLNKIKNDS